MVNVQIKSYFISKNSKLLKKYEYPSIIARYVGYQKNGIIHVLDAVVLPKM